MLDCKIRIQEEGFSKPKLAKRRTRDVQIMRQADL